MTSVDVITEETFDWIIIFCLVRMACAWMDTRCATWVQTPYCRGFAFNTLPQGTFIVTRFLWYNANVGMCTSVTYKRDPVHDSNVIADDAAAAASIILIICKRRDISITLSHLMGWNLARTLYQFLRDRQGSKFAIPLKFKFRFEKQEKRPFHTDKTT